SALATTTSNPARRSTSIRVTVSRSSEPSETGISTRLLMGILLLNGNSTGLPASVRCAAFAGGPAMGFALGGARGHRRRGNRTPGRQRPTRGFNMLEKLFQLKAHHTTVRTEILAGLTTFLTM